MDGAIHTVTRELFLVNKAVTAVIRSGSFIGL